MLYQPHLVYLKSNMDRFIDALVKSTTDDLKNLKSNMDRFIDTPEDGHDHCINRFKIQYG